MAIAITLLQDMFHTIWDEGSGEYFDLNRLDDFFNMAQRNIFEHMLSPDGQMFQDTRSLLRRYERNKFHTQLQPFFRTISGSSSGGKILFSDIATAIQPQEFRGIIDLYVGDSDGDLHVAKWKRKVEAEYQSNLAFFAPQENKPWYYIWDEEIVVLPYYSTVFYQLDLVRMPSDVSNTGPTNSEFPVELINWIVYEAAYLASISVENYEYARILKQKIENFGL